MNEQRIRQISAWLITALFLLACISPLVAVPVPTQSSEVLGTMIAQTAGAAQIQTIVYLSSLAPTSTSTATSLPTKTPTQTPTLVPIIILPFLVTPQTETPTPTQAASDSSNANPTDQGNNFSIFTDKEWVCTVTQKSPPDQAVMDKGQHFNAYWTIVNQGTKTWPNFGVDVVYKAGFRDPGRARQDLASTVIPGGTTTITVPLTAPKKFGTYTSAWSLRVGRTSFCIMKIVIVVK